LKRCGPRGKPGSHISCSRKCKRVWGNEPSHSQVSSHLIWELESKWTFKFLEINCKGQNPLDWRVPYIIEKFLELQCLKWPCMTHLDTQHTNYGQKKGRESNFQFDSWPLKVKNHPYFLACRWRTRYRWKALNKGYNFALELISIGGLHAKLWAFKVVGVPNVGISRLPLGSLETKWHLGASPMAMHTIYYKGEGGGFLQIWAMVRLVSLSLLMVRPNTKVPWHALTNLLFGLCRSVWVSDCLSFFLVPSWS
jgi:hypothetical protein